MRLAMLSPKATAAYDAFKIETKTQRQVGPMRYFLEEHRHQIQAIAITRLTSQEDIVGIGRPFRVGIRCWCSRLEHTRCLRRTSSVPADCSRCRSKTKGLCPC